VDLLAGIALLGVVPGVPVWMVLLRLVRFMVLINPLRNFAQALLKVVGLPDIRKETSMLLGVLAAMMSMVLMAILYLYPHMDLNGDHQVTDADYMPFQLLLFVLRMLMDPGVPPAAAFSPWLVAVTVVILLAGVFFFALMIDLGASFMQKLLEELANSPLSPREQMLVVGSNEQAMPILRSFDKFCGRLRRTFSSVWVFYGEPLAQASRIGRWLAIRRAEPGDRNLVKRFRLSELQHLIIFHKHDNSPEEMQALVDTHHLAREARVDTLVITDAQMSENKAAVFGGSLDAEVVVSASVMTRMLYQSTHCSYMPEIGMRMLDAVGGETGMYAVEWAGVVKPAGSGAVMYLGDRSQKLDQWMGSCFEQGVNLLTGRDDGGKLVLFSDLFRTTHEVVLTDVIGVGSEPILWGGVLEGALSGGEREHHNPLKTFQWPETWDIHIIFLGWHAGLPTMLIEMALKHHKIAFHIFSRSDAEGVAEKQVEMDAAVVEVAQRSKCKVNTTVSEWDGLNIEELTPRLRGCNLIMLYPEEVEGDGEDSVLELWLHRVGGSLQARKEKTKWWTPPKLMVLPRSSGNIGTLIAASEEYPLLQMDVGSPDAFHDLYVSRKMITHAWKLVDPNLVKQELKAYAMMDLLLSDAVALEMTSREGLLAEACESWLDIYREALHRGWMLLAYVMPEKGKDAPSDPFLVLEHLFPLDRLYEGSRMHVLAGAEVMEMDVPTHVDQLLFVRRGVLSEEEAPEKSAASGSKAAPAKKPVASAAGAASAAKKTVKAATAKAPPPSVKSASPAKPPVVAKAAPAKEVPAAPVATKAAPVVTAAPVVKPIAAAQAVEVVDGAEWPSQSDVRLLRVLSAQVAEALTMLQQSSESGLMKLMALLESAPGEVVEAQVMEALGSLQNLDRVGQWVGNVRSVLDDWGQGVQPIGGDAGWITALTNRYVMQEERDVLARVLDAPAAVAGAVAASAAKTVAELVVEPVVDTPVAAAPIAEEAALAEAPPADVPIVEEAVAAAPSAIEIPPTVRPEMHSVEVVDGAEWPSQSDVRLLRVLSAQVAEALTMLQQSSESGLMKLMGLLESAPGEVVEAQVMEALGSLQNLDRVGQWVGNVRSVLDDWGQGVQPIHGEAGWTAALASRYVMQEERDVLARVLDAPVAVVGAAAAAASAAKAVAEKPVAQPELDPPTVADTAPAEMSPAAEVVPVAEAAPAEEEPLMAQVALIEEAQAEEEASIKVEDTPLAEPVATIQVNIVGEWPQQADQRLLRILARQVDEAVVMLQQSSEASLMKLMTLLESAPGEVVEAQIMDGLGSLQNIDRVVQWLTNVRSCLDDWQRGVEPCDGATPWSEAMMARCVMEEERIVILALLGDDG
ncbi:MAG: hypothetical protein R8J84_07760, partial [Mariprofundales bacterium]